MTAAPNVRVLMWRESLENTPRFDLPTGYTLRWYRAGDDEQWLRIHQLADPHTAATPELFAAQFGGDHAALARRQVFVMDPDGVAIATVTAWDGLFEGRRIGRIHWLAVVPEQRGRGLGRALMSLACRRLRELGHAEVYLVTGSVRLAAIRLYLQFGFIPVVQTDEQAAVWALISRELPQRPRLHQARRKR